jgi:transcriptional regulator with XRE-family HTH domain
LTDRKSIEEVFYRRIGSRLASERALRGLTQLDLGRMLGRNQSFVSKVEVGHQRLQVLELVQICEAIDIDYCEVIHAATGERN